jgi:hypothetical protein
MYRQELTYSDSVELSGRLPLLLYGTREHDMGGRWRRKFRCFQGHRDFVNGLRINGMGIDGMGITLIQSCD